MNIILSLLCMIVFFSIASPAMQSSMGGEIGREAQRQVQFFESIIPAKEIAICEESSVAARIVPDCQVIANPILPTIKSLTNEKSRSQLIQYFMGNKRTLDLKAKPATLEDLLLLCSTTSTGKASVSAFLDLQSKGEIKVEFVGSDHMSRSGWGAEYDYAAHTIFLNREMDLGTLAPAFIHELNHAQNSSLSQQLEACTTVLVDNFQKNCDTSCGLKLSPTYKNDMTKCQDQSCKAKVIWSLREPATAYNKPLRDQMRIMINNFYACQDPIVFKSERVAYNAQLKFIDELKKQNVCYDKFITAADRNGHIISSYVPNDFIANSYDLDIRIIEKNLGHPLAQGEPKQTFPLKQFPDVASTSTRFEYFKCLDDLIAKNPKYLKQYEKKIQESPYRDSVIPSNMLQFDSKTIEKYRKAVDAKGVQ